MNRNYKKEISLKKIIYVLVLLVVFMNIKTLAKETNINNKEIIETKISVEKEKEILNSIKWKNIEDNNLILDNKTNLIKDKKNKDEYYEINTNKGRVLYDNNKNKIIGLSKYNNETKEYNKSEIKKNKDDMIRKMNEEYKKLGMPLEYKLTELSYEEEEKMIEARYSKLINGVDNKFQSVKVIFDLVKEEIVSLRKFDMEPDKNTEISKITKDILNKNKEEYEKIIKKTKSKNETVNLNINEAKEQYNHPNNYFEHDKKELKDEENIRRTWEIPVNEKEIVYIDSETGKIIGGTQKLYAEALASDAGYFPSYDQNSRNAMINAFNKLNYFTYQGDANNANVNYWINNGNNHYAFYIKTHGGNNNGQCFFITKEKQAIYPSNIRGNWDFVFIDACNSKDNDSLANGFRIYNGSSKKAYLGFRGTVWTDASTEFVQEFNNRVGRQTIQSAARDAAVGMVKHAPIRFTGDRGWYGYAR